MPQTFEKGHFTFAWPLHEAKETLIFEGLRDPKDAKSVSFDRPVLLSFQDQINPHIKAGPQGEPIVTVYINNKHEVSFDAQLARRVNLGERTLRLWSFALTMRALCQG